MASVFENVSSFTGFLTRGAEVEVSDFQEIYNQNRHRIYSLSFWMTDNELTAEELTERVFQRAFSSTRHPSAEFLDQALIAELAHLMPLGVLSLDCAACTEIANVRRNTLRVHLERAVVQLPATERLVFLLHDVEGCDLGRIGRCLGLGEKQCGHALHQARLRLRELLAAMVC